VTWKLEYTAATVGYDTSYNSINFDLHFKRRHPLLLPLCFIGVLNILVFKIPPACGERIGVTNCLFIYYHLITFILASLITYDKLEKSIQVGI
jgi:hypothetical protein